MSVGTPTTVTMSDSQRN